MSKGDVTNKTKPLKRFGREKLSEKDIQGRIDETHGEGKYLLMEGTYSTYSKKMIVFHECGYKWNVLPNNIINLKTTCPKCSGQLRTRWSNKSFSDKISEISNGEYALDSVFVSAKRIVDIKHLKCGRIRTVLGSSALKGSYKCEMCSLKEGVSKESLGEKKIREYLESHGIIFKPQYRTDDCKYKRQLPFDFALLDVDNSPWAMIEFDGEQHYNRESFFGSDEYTAEYDLEKQQMRDEIKDEYCESNGIIMLRIPYTSINRIDSILNRFFRVHKNFIK